MGQPLVSPFLNGGAPLGGRPAQLDLVDRYRACILRDVGEDPSPDTPRAAPCRQPSYRLSMESGQRAPFSPVELAESDSPVALSATKHGVGGSSSWACLPARGGCGDETAEGSEGYEEES